MFQYRPDSVNLKKIAYSLQYEGQTLQPGAGIDIFLLQGGIAAVSLLIKLGKNEVPYFQEAVTVATHLATGAAAAVFRPQVIIDLRTRAARPQADFPKIIFFPQAVYPGLREPHPVPPDGKSLVVVFINAYIEALFRNIIDPGN